MTKKPPATDKDGALALVVSRVVDAPRETVFKLWSDPAHVKDWWHPRGYTTPVFEMDFRVGGHFRYCIRSQGKDGWARGTYREIVPPERIAFTFAWDSGDAAYDAETLITVTFEAQGDDKTLLTLRQAPFASAENRDGHAEGWGQVLESFGAFIIATQAE